MTSHCRIIAVYALLLLGSLSAAEAGTCDKPELSIGQTLYVPAYSHISHFYGAKTEQTLLLAVTLSIRNTDRHHQIKITKVDYHETAGELMVEYVDTAVVLGPLGSLRYTVPEHDKRGGSGANFIVEWSAEQCANPPIVESIMISTRPVEGVSFTSRGQVIVDSE